jgi:hypothetical protein
MAPTRDTNPSAYQDAFVNELRARREASGLSRNKLAAALGCTPQWIAKVETFEKPPSEGSPTTWTRTTSWVASSVVCGRNTRRHGRTA